MTFFVSRADQADWLTKAYAIAGSVNYVSGLGWFNLHDEIATNPVGLTTGLMTYEGEHKPAYDAYKNARLDGSMPVVSCPAASASTPAASASAASSAGGRTPTRTPRRRRSRRSG